MAAIPAAARESTPTEVRRRISKTGSTGSARDAPEERPPVNKRMKLASPVTSRGDEDVPLFMGDWRGSGGAVSATAPAPVATMTSGKATQTAQRSARYLDPANLQNLRETISQQFDIEILLKHRELGLIEQEIAKTQICIEQLRRCTLKPYQSPEISLEPYIPDVKQLENGPPDYAPPHWSVVDGPYTRHYKQWLLPDPKFDGYGPEGPPVMLAGKGTRGQKSLEQTQTYTVSGRPQRQSVIKVQQRGGTGTQQCIFRRSDGVTVRLECLDCKRSDFSSAQGFINHCRIAHQREYASHEAAAFACGQTVEETDEGFVAPYPRNPVDPPSRNTRQTQQQILTPQSSYAPTPRSSFSGPSGVPYGPTARAAQSPKNKSAPNAGAAQRKNGNRGTRAAMTTPKRQGSEGLRRPPTPPMDVSTFRTPHLEGLLKRKKIEVDLAKMVKEVKGQRINWDTEVWTEDDDESDESGTSSLPGRDMDGDTVMAGVETGTMKEPTRGGIESRSGNAAARQESSGLGVPAAASGRNVSRLSPVPSLPRSKATPIEQARRAITTQNQPSAMIGDSSSMENSRGSRSSFSMGLDGSYDYDASSSDDEDGYKSDADAHEDVEMEVGSATSHSSEEDHASTSGIASFGLRTPLPVQKMGIPSSPQSPHPIVNQPAAIAPISPALSITTEDIEKNIITPVRPQVDQTPPMLTPISPAAVSLSKQVRFVMPNSKGGMRKNPGGVLETGLAKMKFGNAKKSGVFGSGEGRKMEG